MSNLFSSMLHFVKSRADYMKSVAIATPEFKEEQPSYKLFFQDQEVITLADQLTELIPVTRNNLDYQSKSCMKIPLSQFAAALTNLKPPDVQTSLPISQESLEKILIWNFRCVAKDPYSPEPWTYSYIDLILDELNRTVFIPRIQLVACNLSADANRICLNMEWRGPFQNIEYITIPQVTRPFWFAACDTKDPALSLNVMRYLLHLQVAAAWDKNELMPGKVKEAGKLTARMQFWQADSSEPSSEKPMSESSWQNVSAYIAKQFYPRHLEISQKLELKLREELDRRRAYAEQGLLENKFVDQISRWIDELFRYRAAYLAEISNAD